MGQAEEWARQLVNEKHHKREQDQQTREKMLSDRHLVKAKSDSMWLEMRRLVEERVNLLNGTLGENVIRFCGHSDHNRISIRPMRTESELAVLHYMPAAFTLEACGSTYELSPFGTNDVGWKQLNTQQIVAGDSIAEECVAKAFKAVE